MFSNNESGTACAQIPQGFGAAKGKERAVTLNSGCLAAWESSGGMLAAFRGCDTLSLELRARLGGHSQHSYETPMSSFMETCDSGPRAHERVSGWGWGVGAGLVGWSQLLLWSHGPSALG